MALEGAVKDFGLADIFQLIALQKKTGVLTIEGTGNTINIYFHEGRIIYIDALRRWEGDRLGRILEKAGKITREQLERALEINRETKHRLGYILIKENLITKEDLSEALQPQMKRMMFDIFRWKEGTYRFIPKKVSFDEDIITPINTEYILMEGMRILDEWSLIEKRIPSFDMVLRQVQDKKRDPEAMISLSDKDKMVLQLVDGESDIGMIIDSSGLGDVETCNILIRLMDAGLIEEGSPSVERTSAGFEYQEGKRERGIYPFLERLEPRWLRFLIVGILLILTIIAGIRFLDVIKNPFMDTLTVNKIEDLRTTIRLYYLAKGEYPSSLKALVTEGYKKDANIVDPWGRIFVYERKDNFYEIYSAGPDGVKGNEDDIK